jgi:hypothetical protein
MPGPGPAPIPAFPRRGKEQQPRHGCMVEGAAQKAGVAHARAAVQGPSRSTGSVPLPASAASEARGEGA